MWWSRNLWWYEDMKFATFRVPDEPTDKLGASFVALITETETDAQGTEHATLGVQIPEFTDVGQLVTQPPEVRQQLAERALETTTKDPRQLLDVSQATYDTLIPYPAKVFCIGLNYRNHIKETGLELPDYPTVFTKFSQTLTSAEASIAIPAVDHRLDYEGELCVVIGTPGRNIPEDQALDHVAGYTISNDFSLRGYQGRTSEWTQGKFFEATTPIGPWLVTPDEFDPNARITTLVNGEVRQDDSVGDLVFTPANLISYLSEIITLSPGDLILTGTPGGVALAMKNDQGRRPWLVPGDEVETRIQGLGVQHNDIVSS